MNRARKRVSPTAGDFLMVDVLRFDDGWEFDCPTVILAPIVVVYEDGRSCASAVEDFAIDVSVSGYATSCRNLRKYPVSGWRARFDDMLSGKRGPRGSKWFQAERHRVSFYMDSYGLLAFDSVAVAPEAAP